MSKPAESGDHPAVDQLGSHKLLKRIASGGMAEIYAAKRTDLPGFEKIVVIKRILPALVDNQQFVEMFLREARVMQQMQHPNIVQSFDVGRVDDRYFISMEYLHGEDVRALFRASRKLERPLPLEHTLNIVIGTAAGLHYAHEKRGGDGAPLDIVHRDVSPQNVFVTFDGSVKLVDFGIAKAANQLSKTQTGTLKGKFPYMSPEQCRGLALDRRTDIYSLGIMLWELTCGRRLYAGHSQFDIMTQIVQGKVPRPSSYIDDLPPGLEPIIMKALAKSVDDRYRTAQALQADLEAMVREERLVVSPIALAGLMVELFGDRSTAWSQAIASGDDVTALIPTREDDDEISSEAEIVVETSHSSGTGLDTGVTTGETPRALARSRTSESEPAQRSRLSIGMGGVIAVALIAVGTLWWWQSRGAEPSQPSTVSSNRALAADANVANVANPRRSVASDAAVVAVSPPPAPIDAGARVARARTKRASRVSKRSPIKVKPRAVAKPANKPVPVPAATVPQTVEVRIGSTPSCEVLIDGRPAGSTPVVGAMVTPGRHTVRLINSRYGIDKRESITVRPGKVFKRQYDLRASIKRK